MASYRTHGTVIPRTHSPCKGQGRNLNLRFYYQTVRVARNAVGRSVPGSASLLLRATAAPTTATSATTSASATLALIVGGGLGAPLLPSARTAATTATAAAAASTAAAARLGPLALALLLVIAARRAGPVIAAEALLGRGSRGRLGSRVALGSCSGRLAALGALLAARCTAERTCMLSRAAGGSRRRW